MADPEKSAPFYEHRWFKGAVAVVGLVAAVSAYIGLPSPSKVATDVLTTKLPPSNTEIVLDASASMAKPFGKGTKLEAAADAIGQFVAPLSNEGLALRRAGGGCGEKGDLVVNFAGDHGDEVQEAAAKQQPEGSSNMANAVRAAVDDFSDEDFQEADSAKRVLIFMGGQDECTAYASDEIRDELDRTGIDAVFRLVALKVSGKELKQLERFKQELGRYADVEIRTPNTEAQLDEVMHEETEAATASAADEEALEGEEEEREGSEEEETNEEETEGETTEEETTEETTPEEEEEETTEETTPEEEITDEESSGEEETSAEEWSGAVQTPVLALAHLIEPHPATDLHPAHLLWAAQEDRPVPLVDRDRAGQATA